MVNPRTKGPGAEREVADAINVVLYQVRQELGIPTPPVPTVQRNQNQSAVGGKDLVGTPGIAIEVKRQETLSIESWWTQCVASAKALGEEPVLIYRQNGKKWKCILYTKLQVPGSDTFMAVRSEISFDEFLAWFKLIARRDLKKSLQPSAPEGLFGS